MGLTGKFAICSPLHQRTVAGLRRSDEATCPGEQYPGRNKSRGEAGAPSQAPRQHCGRDATALELLFGTCSVTHPIHRREPPLVHLTPNPRYRACSSAQRNNPHCMLTHHKSLSNLHAPPAGTTYLHGRYV